MAENLRTYLQVPTLIQDNTVLLILPSHLEKPTSNRDYTQHLSCRICCPLFSHLKCITIQQVLQELVHCLHLLYTTPVIHAEVFEDNNSAYLLAMNHCLSDPNTLMLSAISFGNTWMQDMSKSPSAAQMNNEQTISQEVWFLRNLKIIEKIIRAGD